MTTRGMGHTRNVAGRSIAYMESLKRGGGICHGKDCQVDKKGNTSSALRPTPRSRASNGTLRTQVGSRKADEDEVTYMMTPKELEMLEIQERKSVHAEQENKLAQAYLASHGQAGLPAAVSKRAKLDWHHLPNTDLTEEEFADRKQWRKKWLPKSGVVQPIGDVERPPSKIKHLDDDKLSQKELRRREVTRYENMARDALTKAQKLKTKAQKLREQVSAEATPSTHPGSGASTSTGRGSGSQSVRGRGAGRGAGRGRDRGAGIQSSTGTSIYASQAAGPSVRSLAATPRRGRRNRRGIGKGSVQVSAQGSYSVPIQVPVEVPVEVPVQVPVKSEVTSTGRGQSKGSSLSPLAPVFTRQLSRFGSPTGTILPQQRPAWPLHLPPIDHKYRKAAPKNALMSTQTRLRARRSSSEN